MIHQENSVTCQQKKGTDWAISSSVVTTYSLLLKVWKQQGSSLCERFPGSAKQWMRLQFSCQRPDVAIPASQGSLYNLEQRASLQKNMPATCFLQAAYRQSSFTCAAALRQNLGSHAPAGVGAQMDIQRPRFHLPSMPSTFAAGSCSVCCQSGGLCSAVCLSPLPARLRLYNGKDSSVTKAASLSQVC